MISSAPIATTFSVKHARQCLASEQPWLVAPWMPLDGLIDSWTTLGKEVSHHFVQHAVSHAMMSLTHEHQALKTYQTTRLQPKGTLEHQTLLADTTRLLHQAVETWDMTAFLLELAYPPEVMGEEDMTPFIAHAQMHQFRVMTIAHAVQQEMLSRCAFASVYPHSGGSEEVLS